MTEEPISSIDDAPDVQIQDCAPVQARLAELALPAIQGLAFLPANFEEATSASDLRQCAETPNLRKILRQSGLEVAEVGPRSAYVVNRSADWVAPVLVISAGLFSENPNVASVALNLISSYVFEMFKGRLQQPTVRLEIVVEQEGDRSSKRVTYAGDSSGLAMLPAVIRSLTSD